MVTKVRLLADEPIVVAEHSWVRKTKRQVHRKGIPEKKRWTKNQQRFHSHRIHGNGVFTYMNDWFFMVHVGIYIYIIHHIWILWVIETPVRHIFKNLVQKFLTLQLRGQRDSPVNSLEDLVRTSKLQGWITWIFFTPQKNEGLSKKIKGWTPGILTSRKSEQICSGIKAVSSENGPKHGDPVGCRCKNLQNKDLMGVESLLCSSQLCHYT